MNTHTHTHIHTYTHSGTTDLSEMRLQVLTGYRDTNEGIRLKFKPEKIKTVKMVASHHKTKTRLFFKCGCIGHTAMKLALCL